MRDYNIPLDKAILCFFDVETTGLHPHYGDRICEIGLAKVINNKIIDSYETLINPYIPISPGAFHVNHITPEMLKSAPSFQDVVNDVLKFIEGSTLVAHNALFDLNFLGSHLWSLSIPFPPNPVIDTLILARAYYNFPSNSLPNLASHFRINKSNSHRALGDAKITGQIFHIFLNDFRRKNGITTLAELLELHGGSLVFPTYGEIILPTEIEEVMKTKKKLKIRYISREGEETIRTIKPIDIVPYRDYTYLIAHCLLRNERRTFRLDRILEMKVIRKQKSKMPKNKLLGHWSLGH